MISLLRYKRHKAETELTPGGYLQTNISFIKDGLDLRMPATFVLAYRDMYNYPNGEFIQIFQMRRPYL